MLVWMCGVCSTLHYMYSKLITATALTLTGWWLVAIVHQGYCHWKRKLERLHVDPRFQSRLLRLLGHKTALGYRDRGPRLTSNFKLQVNLHSQILSQNLRRTTICTLIEETPHIHDPASIIKMNAVAQNYWLTSWLAGWLAGKLA